jgi:orotate phosphoribosyltransferase
MLRFRRELQPRCGMLIFCALTVLVVFGLAWPPQMKGEEMTEDMCRCGGKTAASIDRRQACSAAGNGDDVARTTRARMMTAPAPQHHDAKSEDALDRSDARWLRLQEIIRVQSLKVGEFVLSSGRTSTYLFQLRQTTMLPEGAALIGDIIVDYMKRHAIPCIGGLEMGAVPIVAAVAAVSHLQNYPVDAFFVRKSQKEHGARERVDGHLRAGAEVLMIDDVATTGGSILKAIEGIEGHDCHVRRALAVVDREEGAAQNLAARGIQLAAIFKRSDFPEV